MTAITPLPDNQRKASSSAAFTTFFKSMLGAGLLALPNVFGEVRLVLGATTYSIVTLGCAMSCYLLLKAQSMVIIESRRTRRKTDQSITRVVTYGDLASFLFNPFMAFVTRWTIISLNFFFTAGLIIVICENMSSVTDLSHHAIGMILLPVVILMLQLPLLQDMFFVSVLGIVVYSIGVMGSTLFSAYLSISSHSPNIPIDIVTPNWSQFPNFVGSAVYALEGINLALPTAHSMQNKHHVILVVCCALILYGLLTLCFAVAGFIGGLGGEKCDIVTECIRPPWLKVVVQVTLSVAMVFTIPIMLFPTTEMLEIMLSDWKRGWDKMKQDKSEIMLIVVAGSEKNDNARTENKQFAHTNEHKHERSPLVSPNDASENNEHENCVILRLILAFLTVSLGAFVPSFTLFSAFVGAIGLTFAGFILPPWMYIRAMRKYDKKIGWPMWFCLFCLFSFGVLNMLVGGFRSGMNLFEAIL